MSPLLGFFLVVALVVIAALVIAVRRRRSESEHDGMQTQRIGDGIKRLNAGMEKYALMTRGLLNETPDDAVLEAVLFNLWAKMKQDLSDATEVIGGLSRERQMIFALYSVTGDVKQDGFEKALAGPDAAMIPIAAAGLDTLEMPGSARLLREAIETGEADAYDEPYLESFLGEKGKEKMTAYIRTNPDRFCDLA